jgi:predicted RNase H-like nuclease (RuvC/YqgF family)
MRIVPFMVLMQTMSDWPKCLCGGGYHIASCEPRIAALDAAIAALQKALEEAETSREKDHRALIDTRASRQTWRDRAEAAEERCRELEKDLLYARFEANYNFGLLLSERFAFGDTRYELEADNAALQKRVDELEVECIMLEQQIEDMEADWADDIKELEFKYTNIMKANEELRKEIDNGLR